MMDQMEETLGKRGPAWTRGTTLPGGDFPATGYPELVENFTKRFPFVASDLMERLVRHYGTDVDVLLDGMNNQEDMGLEFGAGLFEAEVRYLMQYEWAMHAEDILFRRTRLGISMTEAQIEALREYMDMSAKPTSMKASRKS